MLITGQAVAQKILLETKNQIEQAGITPGLGVILVGDDAPSHLYVGIKERRAKELGIYFEKKVFPDSVSQDVIERAIADFNADKKIHGIIVQIPLPEHLDTESIIACIDPKKDTDGFHPETLEKFLAGETALLPVFPRALLELAKSVEGDTSEKKALVIINSELMGKVLSAALNQSGFEVTQAFADEKELIAKIVPEQSVVLTAVGVPNTVSAVSAKPGSIFVDGGIYYDEDDKVVGDVTRDDGVYREDVLVTKVPGGVGPVTVAVLLARVTEAALMRIL